MNICSQMKWIVIMYVPSSVQLLAFSYFLFAVQVHALYVWQITEQGLRTHICRFDGEIYAISNNKYRIV